MLRITPGLLLFFCLAAPPAHAQAPAWWAELGVVDPAVDQGAARTLEQNYAPALLGQAKNLARAAYLAMEAREAGSAGVQLRSLIEGFSMDPEVNYVPLMAGQLKVLVAPFYRRFRQLDFPVPGHIQLNAEGYPWGEQTPLEDNYRAVNLGQLKYVFSFDLADWPPNLDSDADGLPDEWETAVGLNPLDPADAVQDQDEDGLSALEEYLAGTLPLERDTDGDLLPDGWEARFGLDPAEPGDAAGDRDGDGLLEREEYQSGTSPIRKDNPSVGLRVLTLLK